MLPFVALAVALWTGAWLLVRKARRGRSDPDYRARLGELLEGEPPPLSGERSASPWLWVGAAILALLAFGVTLCTGAVLFGNIH